MCAPRFKIHRLDNFLFTAATIGQPITTRPLIFVSSTVTVNIGLHQFPRKIENNVIKGRDLARLCISHRRQKQSTNLFDGQFFQCGQNIKIKHRPRLAAVHPSSPPNKSHCPSSSIVSAALSATRAVLVTRRFAAHRLSCRRKNLRSPKRP